MSRGFAVLGDVFPNKDIGCRIRGCNNVWHFSGEQALQNIVEGKSPRPDRMCDACFEKFRSLQDVEAPCATPECKGTWTWNRIMQLEAQMRGHTTPPHGLCNDCRRRLAETADMHVPCRMKGCTGTWTWPAREQVLHPGQKPPARLCDQCYDRLQSLSDRDVPCRVNGCTRTWRWNRFQQLEHLITGGSLEPAPRRMCDACFVEFGKLQDVEVPCPVKNCTRKWTFSRYAQLEHKAATGSNAPPQDRMCEPCFRFQRRAQDWKVPCLNRGCPNTWPYTRDMQHQDWLAGIAKPEPRLCTECADKLAKTPDRAVPCEVRGCTNTWTYAAADQVRDACLGKPDTPSRRCASCEEFLATRETLELPCQHCEKPIRWSAFEQLLCSLGTFVKPARCTACTGQVLAMGKPEQKIDKDHHLVVKMPSHGRWQQFERIRNWPTHLTYEVIERVEHADACIVALGDDLTHSSDTVETSWPYLLDKTLNEALQGRAKVVVVNAGIPKSTSAQALIRLSRDVFPFRPQLVLFSFAFADSVLWLNRHERTWHANLEPEKTAEAMETLCRELAGGKRRLLYWTPNPIFPQDHVDTEAAPQFQAWTKAQLEAREQYMRQVKLICKAAKVPILDIQTRFEVNGTRSAKKWMADWCLHNATGAQNMAAWFAEHILHEKLLNLPQPQ
ncbi:MAG: hypothetical protein A3K18_22725 [Lentisphaerae bacterium RIFOXYA12_64_32]|nr:MAG: hypothetical protein A3K18_22725 [Lentisphaerae bacterium RIFOXYA12_64_32]